MVVIKIFDAKDTNFNTAGNIIIEPLYCHEIKKKSLNGWYIDVEIPINYKKYIEQDKLCVVQTKSKLNPQAFRIKDIEYTTNKIVFQAQHVMFDAEDYFLLDSRPTNQSGLNALNYINGMTDKVSPFTMYSNVENISTAYLIRKNLLEAWSIIEERWGGIFDADNWNISFLTSVGNDNGETIYYGKNLEDMKIIEDWSGVCTKLYPVGKDEIMLADKYLESTIQYDIPYTRTINFDTELSDEEQTEENLLIELEINATNYLQENCVPKVCYEINSNINQDMEIGDIIQVKHPLCNISTEVLEYEYDVILRKITKLVFGNYSKDVKKKFKAVTNTIESIKEAVNKQQTTINNQTNLINSLNKNGYVYIDENEILLLDAIPKEKAKNVWRFGLAGIGFSSNGYEGPFEIAITMDGQINAKFITTGTMSVSRIEGLANFISETEKQIAEIEIEQGNITSRVSSVETLANNAQSTADSAVEGVNNITNTQGEAEGKSIHIEDSAEEPFVDVELYGESVQEGTPTPDSPIEIENVEGKNKFNKSNMTEATWDNGKTNTVTLLEDGRIQSTANYAQWAAKCIDIPNLKANTNYVVSGKIVSSTAGNTIITIKGYKNNTLSNIIYRQYAVGTKFELSFNSSDYEKIGISLNGNNGTLGTIYTTIFDEIQLEEGTVATPYVPYNTLEFKVEGKNRFNKSIYTSSAYNGYFLKNILKVGQNYTISFKNIENKTYGFLIKSMAGAAMISDMFEKYSKTAVTFNYTQAMYDKGYTLFIISMSDYQPLSIDEINNMDIQLEEGSIATDYEPYKSQVATFPLGEGEKLMEGSYLADDGIHNARKQVVFDGSDDEGWSGAYFATEGYIYTRISDKKAGKTNFLCTHFPVKNQFIADANTMIGNATQNIIAVFPSDDVATSLEEWKAYLAEHPITVEYELAEPETVLYTEKQQEAWNKIKALMTYKNITNITSTAYAKVTYMRDNGLDVYETKQNAQKTSEKLAEQKMTVDGVITKVSDITSKTDELTGEVKTINSEISTVKQTIEGWSSELKNTGGNNIFYYSLDFWDNSNGLQEYSDTEIMQNSISQAGYVLNNGSAKQTQSVKNGFYTCSFNYKKLLELAVCQVKINGTTYDLTETDWVEFEQAFEVKTNKIEIEFIGDTDSSLYISDLMVNVGTTKLSWSQNANETRTDTVTIGKGIQVNSSAKNTYHRIDADGNRTFNKTTGKVVNEATDKGTETEELVVRGQAKITGLLIQKVSDQVWINSLL